MNACCHCERSDRKALKAIRRSLMRVEIFMATQVEVLTQVKSGLSGLQEDVTRFIEALQKDELRPEAQAMADGLIASFAALNEQMDSVVPPAGAPVEPVEPTEPEAPVEPELPVDETVPADGQTREF